MRKILLTAICFLSMTLALGLTKISASVKSKEINNKSGLLNIKQCEYIFSEIKSYIEANHGKDKAGNDEFTFENYEAEFEDAKHNNQQFTDVTVTVDMRYHGVKSKNQEEDVTHIPFSVKLNNKTKSGKIVKYDLFTRVDSAKVTLTPVSRNEIEAAKALGDIKKLIDKKELEKNFKHLVKTQRVRGTKENKAAGKYIADTVKGYGYDVKFQNFTGYDEKLSDINGNTNKNQKKGKVLFTGRNIIVKRKNPKSELKTVIFSARYDSREKSIGALDNAGGTAALMEMARILADMDLSYNPEFIFFDSENLRRGSRYYVENLSKEDKENIYCVVNINCIGNKKQRKQTFFASNEGKNPLRALCKKYFPNALGNKATETDAATFEIEKIPTACYFTLDFFAISKREIGDKFVFEKDASLVDMDTLITDTTFITAYASLLKVNTPKAEKRNESYKFVRDTSLDKYIDKSLQDKVLQSEPGADTPTTYFVNNKYIGVLCRKGILIFDRNNVKLNTVIDIEGLGFERTQGDNAILDKAGNDYLVLYKSYETKGYVYSFKEGALAKIDNISKVRPAVSVDRSLEPDEYNKMLQNVEGCVGSLKYGKNYVALIPDYDNIKNSLVYVFDEKFNVTMKFAIGVK